MELRKYAVCRGFVQLAKGPWDLHGDWPGAPGMPMGSFRDDWGLLSFPWRVAQIVLGGLGPSWAPLGLMGLAIMSLPGPS